MDEIWPAARFKTPEECLEGVRKNGSLLLLVPEELKTEAVCLAAVRDDGWALAYVPEAARTPELCAEAVRHADLSAAGEESVLRYVPDGMMDSVLAILQAQESGENAESSGPQP